MFNQREKQAYSDYCQATQAALGVQSDARKQAAEAYDAALKQAEEASAEVEAAAWKVFDETIKPAQEAYKKATEPFESAMFVARIEADAAYYTTMAAATKAYLAILKERRNEDTGIQQEVAEAGRD